MPNHVETFAPRGAAQTALPLCVDLDGTLIRSDVLWESLLALVRHKPGQLWRVPLWAVRGKCSLKSHLAAHSGLEARALPYNEDVLSYLREARAAGRPLFLTTATHEHVARQVAAHIDLFDDVLATSETLNLKGPHKLAALRARFPGGFEYAGDAPSDLVIFEAADAATVVHARPKLAARMQRAPNLGRIFPRAGGGLRSTLRMLRVHQWAKNVLLAVPIIAGHQLLSWPMWGLFIVAFFSFSLAASAVYILNDLMDLPHDRQHPQKKHRPLAAGAIAIPTALAWAMTLFAGAWILAALTLPGAFLAWLGAYLIATTAYTFVLKRRTLIDVITLAGLYTVRILAGGAATGIVLSQWLLAFSMFLFISLAFAKRYTELVQASAGPAAAGRGYRASDASVVLSVGPACGLIAALVVALYISSPEVARLYASPAWLWWVCPLVIYWITRIWFLAGRNELPHDPVIFALRDGRSYVVAILGAAILLAATYGLPGLGGHAVTPSVPQSQAQQLQAQPRIVQAK